MKSLNMKRFIIIALIVLSAIVLFQDFINYKNKHTPPPSNNYVIMLSLDGFRHDYTDSANTPTFDYISKNGVKASLQASFPTITFPNHYTIATGLYPGNHGIIANSFYATDLNKYYSIYNKSAVSNGLFYGGEPIWVTASSQKIKTATNGWVGSEAKIKGYYPDIMKKYDKRISFEQKADTVLAWLQLPHKYRPHLIAWYDFEPDHSGHKFGSNSIQVKNSVERIDSLLGIFINKLASLDIKDSIDFIIVSDHGMTQTDINKTVYMEDYINFNWVDTILSGNPIYYVYTKEDCVDSLYTNLKKAKHINVWKKEEIPERFHLKQNERVSNIVVVADSAWSCLTTRKRKLINGIHGYDNSNSEMNAIFYAYGHSFKQDYNAGLLYNTDIYNLITKLLKIKPAPNDGKPERIMHIVKE